jgi:hypothetical protein
VVDKNLKPRKGSGPEIFFHPKWKGVFQRIAGGLKMLFAKASSAKVKPRLDFEDSGKAKAKQVVERNFIDAYSEALRTRK